MKLSKDRIQELVFKAAAGDATATTILSRAGRRGGEAKAAWGHSNVPPPKTQQQLVEEHMQHPDFTRDEYWLGKHAEAAFIDELEKISGVMSFFRKAKPVAEKLEGSFHEDVAKAVGEGNYEQKYHEIMARAKTRGELPTVKKTRHWGESAYAF